MPIEAAFTVDAPVLTFVYADKNNDITRRAVQPLGMIRLKDGSLGIRAMCQMRGALRTFSLRSIQAIHAIDGALLRAEDRTQDGAGWHALETVVEKPKERLLAAEGFSQWGGPAATQAVGDALVPAQTALHEVGKYLTIALAWRDPEGQARLDLDKDACAGFHTGSAHQALARRAALRHSAALLLAAAPLEALYVAWKHGPHLGQAAWSPNGLRWLPLHQAAQAA